MKPRVTVSLSDQNEIEIWLNEKGRDDLVRELEKLDSNNDHFNMSIVEPSELLLSKVPYRSSDKIIKSGKFLIRLDSWDEEYFPHVLKSVSK